MDFPSQLADASAAADAWLSRPGKVPPVAGPHGPDLRRPRMLPAGAGHRGAAHAQRGGKPAACGAHMKSAVFKDYLHHRVLQAAGTLFLKNGYRVSMSAVAHQAGVSKQTVYAHFCNKEALFKAAVSELMHPLHASLASSQRDLAGTLHALAQAHQAFVLDPDQVALGRMLIAEAPRFPQVARMLFDMTMGELQQRLTGRLAEAMTRGELRADDPAAAAELFLSMLNGLESDRRLLGVPGRSRQDQDSWAAHAVALFLQAYAPHAPMAGARHRPTPAKTQTTESP